MGGVVRERSLGAVFFATALKMRGLVVPHTPHDAMNSNRRLYLSRALDAALVDRAPPSHAFAMSL